MLLAVPIAQVLLLRFINPPFTLTMVERAWETVGSDDGLRWPVQRRLSLEDMGRYAPRMAVASEDGWFFHHGGFDTGQIHDALTDMADGEGSRGASTISQQVARNAFLWQGRSWIRKGLEVGYTVLLELLVPKERILEVYLNVAEMGPMTFGVEAGAQRWFHKPAKDLTAQEAARLISILPSPNRWSPLDDTASRRARRILERQVPFPGDPGYEQMVEDAPSHVGVRALLGW